MFLPTLLKNFKRSHSIFNTLRIAKLYTARNNPLYTQKLQMSSISQPIEVSGSVKSIPENIWVKSVDLVRQYQPVNLGQGFPDFPEVVPPLIKEALIETQSADAEVFFNQYCRGQGHPLLVKEIADIYGPLYSRNIDPMKEVLVTVGGYEALHCIINAVTNPGDEIILIEPFFDSYSESVRQCHATARFISLKMKPGGTTSADFVFDKNELAGMFNEKTKAIIVNTPHNPTGKVFSRDEIEFIADLCKKHNCLYLSDEVYEWLLYEGCEHVRAATLPGMWERTATVCSAGKAFNVTGWKTGWLIGPEYLVTASMKVHQGIVYTVPTPLQVALAKMFRQEKELIGTKGSYWHWLCETMSGKRERIYKMLSGAGFHPIIPQGGYFMVADIRGLEKDSLGDSSIQCFDQRISEWLIKEKGIASIPVSAFFSEDHKWKNDSFLRFCFIKGEMTLDLAEEKFNLLSS